MISVIEFQKRGRSHAHIVMAVAPDVTVDEVDDIVSAEVPGN